ncbi:MAG: TetR/AcrR family transcriptional regulator [Deltaproteobacteria bacterium]|nr:TetR/AcrR family transcriptional regulator [Deltaproteobacteria bacterium]MBW2448500.1 TetR/AcrR family transcriptional regulator [Deltaproteobacteria bacterium]
MGERRERIIEATVELAEKGGFEAVRLRDVASHSGVALGTVYRNFSSKEDLLVGALSREMILLQKAIRRRPPKGDTPLERANAFFRAANRGVLSRPNFARAVIRALATGNPEMHEATASFHDDNTALIAESIVGGAEISDRDQQVAAILQNVWFASLVGWAGGLFDDAGVTERVQVAAEQLLG